MSNCGVMAVDWEDRIDFRRLQRERLAKTRQAMVAAGVDALLLFRWENLRYTTGQRYVEVRNSPFEHCASFVAMKQDGPPTLFTMDADDIRSRVSAIPAESLEPHFYVQTESGAAGLLKRLQELGFTTGKLGVDLWDPTTLKVFEDALSPSQLVNGQDVLTNARMVKTDDEIECLKVAYSMGEAALQEGIDFLKPGVRECEVQAVIWKRGLELGAESFQSPAIVTSKTGPYRRFTSDNIILEGDSVIFDVGPVYNGYFSDFVRTWYCGRHTKPSAKARDQFKRAHAVLQTVISSMKPGVTTGEVFSRAGDSVLGRMLGHGIGLAGQEPPFITETEAGIDVELQAGMVFSVEPYVRMSDLEAGFRLEEHVLITKDGPEVYSTFPHGPFSE